jgi:hypothetical protein
VNIYGFGDLRFGDLRILGFTDFGIYGFTDLGIWGFGFFNLKTAWANSKSRNP